MLAAENGRAALECAPTPVRSISSTHVVMPVMGGHQLAKELLAARPGLRVLYMSGYAENVIVHQGVLDPGVVLITSPLARLWRRGAWRCLRRRRLS